MLAPPLTANWTRRAYHACKFSMAAVCWVLTTAVIVGNWAYVHMGELAVGSVPYSNPVAAPLSYTPSPVNGTVAFDLSRGWTDPRQVEYRSFNKPQSADYNFGALWYDKPRNQVFSFGGEQSLLDANLSPAAPAADLSTWRFQPDGQGRGAWAPNATSTTPPFGPNPLLLRPFGGASSQSDKMAFYLSGYSSSHSSDRTQSLSGFQPTPGLITYEFATGNWQNLSIPSTTALGLPHGTFEWGGMEFVAGLGPNGMLVIWGGESSEAGVYTPGQSFRSMNTVTLFDPVEKTWFAQQTSGTAPSARSRFCSMTVSDDSPLSSSNNNGSHEIYMYGGWGGRLGPSNTAFDEVWVLSLPAFTWQKLDASQKSPRIGHTCHLAGNRHLLSIGGADPSLSDPWSSPDYVNVNGLGVFDVSAAQWRPGLNATAEAYRRPQKVQKFYDQSGPYPVWTMPSLERVLTGDTSGSITLDSSAPPPSSAQPGFPSNLPQVNDDGNGSSRSAHIGTIVGATIGGILAAVLPFVLLMAMLRRRQRAALITHHELGAEARARSPSRMHYHPSPIGASTGYGLLAPTNTSRRTTQSGSMSRYFSYGRIKSKLLFELPANEPCEKLPLPEPVAAGRSSRSSLHKDPAMLPYFGSFAPPKYSPSRRAASYSSSAATEVEYPASLLEEKLGWDVPQHPAVRPPPRTANSSEYISPTSPGAGTIAPLSPLRPYHERASRQPKTTLTRTQTRSSAGALPSFRKRSSSVYTSTTRTPSRRWDSRYEPALDLWLPSLGDGVRDWEQKQAGFI